MEGEQQGQMQADSWRLCQPAAIITAQKEDYSKTAEQSVMQGEVLDKAMSGPEVETFTTGGSSRPYSPTAMDTGNLTKGTGGKA